MSEHAEITLRRGRPGDAQTLMRLAQLDSAKPPRAPLLIAEVCGSPRAAISLADGAVIADPFHPTASLVELLRARQRQLSGAPRWRRRRFARRRTVALG